MRTLLAGATIVPIRPRAQVLENAAIGFDSDTGLILELVASGQPSGEEYDQILNASGTIIMPGLVNGHGHAVQTWYRGSQEQRPLELWRQYIKARDRRLRDDDLRLGALLSAVELLRDGCTTTMEHFYATSSRPAMGAEAVLDAWAQVGIRGVLAPMLTDVGFEQSVGISLPADDPAAQAEIARITRSETAATVDDVAEFVAAHLSDNELVSFRFGPSAPHRCSEGLIRRVAELSEELGVGWHMHVAETAKQYETSLATFGRSPVARLHHLGVLSADCSLAHVNHCSDEDIDHLAKSGAAVVHNPVSNMKLGSGIARIPAMRAAGVTVALGVDGAASNDSQNMREVMKAAAVLRGVSGDHFSSWLSAWDVLEMGTLGGAVANGLGHLVGSLEVGKRADLVVIGRTPGLVPLNDVARQLVFTGWEDGIRRVYVGGRLRVQDGTIPGLDVEGLFDEVEARFVELRREFAEADLEVAALEKSLASGLY